MKLNTLTTHKPSVRQDVINELIDEKVKIKEGKKFGIVDPTSSDIDQSYASMSSRMRITPEQLTKSLESQGVRPDTLKMRMKADYWFGPAWSAVDTRRACRSARRTSPPPCRPAATKNSRPRRSNTACSRSS